MDSANVKGSWKMYIVTQVYQGITLDTINDIPTVLRDIGWEEFRVTGKPVQRREPVIQHLVRLTVIWNGDHFQN